MVQNYIFSSMIYVKFYFVLYYRPKRIQGESWLRAGAFGSLRLVSNTLSRTSMKDSNMAIPALVPGLAHSGSPTVLSTCREARVSAQSTGCEDGEGEEKTSAGVTTQ